MDKSELEVHLEILKSAVVSPVFSDQDRQELFELVVGFCRGKNASDATLVRILNQFHEHRPALYSDCVRSWFTKRHRDEDVQTLLRQLADPEVDEEAVVRSILHLVKRSRNNDDLDPVEVVIVAPMVYDLRRGSLVEANLLLSLEDLSKTLEKIFGIEIEPFDEI